ncbi:MAG: 4-hydroxythreonine-4-phosphate dehydrogenase PdxA [Hyphomicrobiaceae bacterium]|nr:MAG: 4-hydroxythreonine-4-phosphate dehydrogenase PdxA [Hyphomicrobiaceae bacterium]
MTARPPSPARKGGRKPPDALAVTIGDPAGIGLDITLVSWRDRRQLGLPPFALYGDTAAVRARARVLGIDAPLATVAGAEEAAAAFDRALPICTVVSGKGGGAADALVIAAIEAATAAVAEGNALALVTNPIAKRSLQAKGYSHPGHTEFLAALAAQHRGGRSYRPVMMLASDELKVVPVTVHMPLSAVPAALTRPLLTETIRITHAALAADFGIAAPRLAVTGLNPHAGESGLMGGEEAAVIAPVVAELAAEGMAITGPHSADTLFHAEARRGYDAAIAMYHDQALIPLKTLAFDHGVNVTLGLPFVRTSPDHGTAFALAGTGKARPGSFVAAVRLAAELGRRRATASLPPAP